MTRFKLKLRDKGKYLLLPQPPIKPSKTLTSLNVPNELNLTLNQRPPNPKPKTKPKPKPKTKTLPSTPNKPPNPRRIVFRGMNSISSWSTTPPGRAPPLIRILDWGVMGVGDKWMR